MVEHVKRFEEDIERQARKLSAAAYSVLINGGTVEEAHAAFEEGIAEAQASITRSTAAREQFERFAAGDYSEPAHAAQTPAASRLADTERPAESPLTVPRFPPAIAEIINRHSAA
jgi:hypothetical protein